MGYKRLRELGSPRTGILSRSQEYEVNQKRGRERADVNDDCVFDPTSEHVRRELRARIAGPKMVHLGQSFEATLRVGSGTLPSDGRLLCVPKTSSVLIDCQNHVTFMDHVRSVLVRRVFFGLAIQVEKPA